MRQILFLFIASVILFSCKKTNSPNHQSRIISDTLMFYSQPAPNGKPSIISKSFKTGETKTLFFDGDHPFATNLRLVYIKSGTTLGFAKVDGVARLLIPLTQPSSPSLSIDSRLICLVDKLPDKYQLLKYDTLGNKTTLFETADEIASPSFSSDGQKIVFTQKTSANSSSLFIIPVTEGPPKRITTALPDSYDEYCTVANETVYFTRSRIIDSTLSSEIFSSDFGGSSITQLTNFTNNWTTSSFFIKNLRKVSNGVVDSSSLICVSNYNNTNTDIYLYKIGGNLTRMTETDEFESFPTMIPNFVK
jgi:Tol biopolymer transport system component